MVDAFAKHAVLLNSYKDGYNEYILLKKELEKLQEEERKSKTDLDYYQFQFNELDEAGLKDGEQVRLESETQMLTHAEEIREHLYNAHQVLSGSDDNLVQHLSAVTGYFNALIKYDPKYTALLERVKSSIIELKDISAEAEHLESQVKADPKRLEIVNERLDVIYRLEQKHHVQTVEELIALQMELSDKLAGIGSMEAAIEKLQQEVDLLLNRLLNEAKVISQNRSKCIPKIEKAIKDELASNSPDTLLLFSYFIE